MDGALVLGLTRELLGCASDEHLERLLRRFESEIARLGLEFSGALVADLSWRDQLYEALMVSDGTADALVEALVDVGTIAGDAGMASLDKSASRLGVQLVSEPRSMSAYDLAIIAYLDHSECFQVARAGVTSQDRRLFSEFELRAADKLDLSAIERAREAVQDDVAAWCATNNRTAASWVSVYPRGQHVYVSIVHGKPRKRVTVITDECTRAHESLVPDSQDSVVFDLQSRTLSIHAERQAEVAMYRKIWGRRLFGDVEAFQVSKRYTLCPLQTQGVHALSTEGIDGLRSVALKQLFLLDEEGGERLDFTHSYDNLGVALQRSFWRQLLAFCKVSRAKFLIKTDSRPSGFTLELVLPNKLSFDRRHEKTVRAYLVARGFARSSCPGAVAQ